jgi:hypothetical protein
MKMKFSKYCGEGLGDAGSDPAVAAFSISLTGKGAIGAAIGMSIESRLRAACLKAFTFGTQTEVQAFSRARMPSNTFTALALSNFGKSTSTLSPSCSS